MSVRTATKCSPAQPNPMCVRNPPISLNCGRALKDTPAFRRFRSGTRGVITSQALLYGHNGVARRVSSLPFETAVLAVQGLQMLPRERRVPRRGPWMANTLRKEGGLLRVQRAKAWWRRYLSLVAGHASIFFSCASCLVPVASIWRGRSESCRTCFWRRHQDLRPAG